MNKIYTTIILVIGVAVLLLPSSCEADYYVPEDVVISDTVSFSVEIQPIFSLHCNNAGCHSTGGVAPDLTPDHAYSNLVAYGLIDTGEPESSTIYLRMTATNKPMPPVGKLSDSNIEIVLAWIRQGAQNN